MPLIMRFLVLIALSFFLYKRQKRYLRYLQQEDYDAFRFLKWVKNASAFDTRGTLIALVGWILSLIIENAASVFLIFGYTTLALFEKNPEHYGKKHFVKTARARRVLLTAVIFHTVLVLPIILWASHVMVSLGCIAACQTAPLFLACSVFLLSNDEKRRQKKLLAKAHRRLLEVNPYVIGITGSYGKTTTKHFLSKLLNMTLGPAYHPNKGINTPMGITRDIQTHLRDRTSYAVIEMAAYGPGSISALCQLTPPQGAILTTIGLAHLERFGSQDIIRKTKAELAQSVPNNGFLILNGDDAHCRGIGRDYPKQTVLYYGFDETLGHLDLKISLKSIDEKGSELKLKYGGHVYECKVPIYGKPLLSNLGASFLTACHLGADPTYAASSLTHLDPVDNRLHIQTENNITYIHDAYNSNPSGFEAALKVLQEFPGKRRILMTPGMVELGQLQESENERVVSLAHGVDVALIIGKTNRFSLERGLLKSGLLKKDLYFLPTRDEAFILLKTLKRAGDIILIENDLPDLYEMKERF